MLSRFRRLTLGVLASGFLGACGSSPTAPPPPPTPTPIPAVTVTAVGEGDLVLHPSADARFFYALETPLRIRETTGGTADWNFARISYFLSGREIERNEVGSDIIRAAGFGRIAANSNQLIRVAFRSNQDRFDRIDIVLGFADLKDARQFTVAVPFIFNQVTTSPVPIFAPTLGFARPVS